MMPIIDYFCKESNKYAWLKTVLLSIFSFAFLVLNARQAWEITYHRSNKGEIDTSYSITLKYKNGVAYLSDAGDKTRGFIDYNRNMTVDIIRYNGQDFKTIRPLDSLPRPELTSETDTLLGYICKKAVFKAFSNTIEIWYTDETEAKGSPYKNYLPGKSLVLQIMVNGGRKLVATEIKKLPEETAFEYPFDETTTISKPEFRELQIKSRYVIVPVFERQQINFGDSLVNPGYGHSDTTYRFSKGTVILKKIKLPAINKKGAIVYAALTEWSNGDAYDRTGSVFCILPGKEKTMLDAMEKGLDVLPVVEDNQGGKYQGIVSTSGYSVPVELMRFFTPFGVGHFNDKREINNYPWADSAFYKEEITALIPATEEEIWIGVFIGNYDKGGHIVSLELDFYPGWEEQTEKKYIKPLFSTINILEMSGQNYGRLFGNDTLSADFVLPDSMEDLQLVYTTTGHGGWGGGDEFNPKRNQVFIDGKQVFSHIPWRSDCATYRMSNPASGNFNNGISSSDLSRSNWCPGTVTPPFIIPLDGLKPGKHTIEVVINQGKDEGNSFSHWQVSGVLTGRIPE
jgi:hypothetical protein